MKRYNLETLLKETLSHIVETYYDNLSDTEKNDVAMSYFSIGQEDDENVANSWCWIWSKSEQSIKAKKGGSHSMNFGPNAKDYTFSGWYDPEKDIISVAFPDNELRKLGDRKPTVDDIPEQIYRHLISKFGKRTPKIVVFESMFPKDFKRHDIGTCISAAAMATVYLLKKGIKNFTIVEGFISMYPGQEEDDWEPHTWIEFDDGRKFDPTKQQWKKKGFDVEKTEYKVVSERFTPHKYIRLCQIQGDLPFPVKENINEEMTYKDLLDLTAKTPRSPEDDTNRIDRSKAVSVRSLPVSVEDNLEQWNFRYKSDKATGNPGEPLEGHISFLKGSVDRRDSAEDLECKVDCSCLDYRYKFAYNNARQKAGDVGPDSLNKAINRPPKPAYNIGEGLCKHLSAIAKYLQTKVAATKKTNLFEAMNDVVGQGPFSVNYED